MNIILLFIFSLFSYSDGFVNYCRYIGHLRIRAINFRATSEEIEFLPSKKKVSAVYEKNIIDFAKSHGISIPYSCRKGTCSKCVVKMNGKVILACRTKTPKKEEFPKNKLLQITLSSP